MVQIFGTLAVVASFLGIFLGITLQIIKNWKRKSCVGLSLTQWVITLFCNILWGAYGYCKGDICLMMTNPPSMILVSIILWQFFIYRSKRKISSDYSYLFKEALKHDGPEIIVGEKVFSNEN